MKLRAFNILIFVGLTAWSAPTKPWLAPGFAALAASQLTLFAAALFDARGSRAVLILLLFLSLAYLGLAYLLSLFAGTPRSYGFWAAFGAAVLILAPIVFLAQRLLVRD